jgi:O-antigen/teichoic acid export membrane protein
MGHRLSIFKNTLALAVPNVINPFVSFLLILVISRYLGVEGLGQYSLVLAYAGIFTTFASLGLGDLIVREIAKNPRDIHTYFFNAVAFGLVSSLVSVLAMNTFVAVMGYEKEVARAAFVMSLSLTASTTAMYLEAVFRSIEKSQYIALTYMLENTLKVGVCGALVLQGYGIVPLFAAVLCTRVFAVALLLYFYKKVVGAPEFRFSRELWKNLAKQAPTFSSIAIFSTIHLSMDQIMLSKLQSIESVGVYSAADKLLAICKTIPVAFASALLPFFTKKVVVGSKELQELALNSIRHISLLTFPIVAGTVVLGDVFIAQIYGEKFFASGPVLCLHILSLIPFSMVYILAQTLIASDNQRVDLIINIIAAALNFGLNLALIPLLGVMGAVAATLLSIIVFNELQCWYIRRFLFQLPVFRTLHRILIASVAMAAFTFAVRDWNVILNVALSATVYAALVIALGAISREELQFLKEFVRSYRKEEV